MKKLRKPRPDSTKLLRPKNRFPVRSFSVPIGQMRIAQSAGFAVVALSMFLRNIQVGFRMFLDPRVQIRQFLSTEQVEVYFS